MVLVSHAHRFIFLKTRKTAGTSIEMLLEPFCAAPGHTVREGTPQIVTRAGIIGARQTAPRRAFAHLWQGVWRNHLSAEGVLRRLGSARFEAYLKITSVRNPFARTVSLFHFLHPRPEAEDFATTCRAFRKFVSGRWPDDASVVHVAGRFVPQVLIRTERLGPDLAALGQRLGLDLSGAPPRAKADDRPRRPVADYFDPASIATVRTRLAWVFDHADYPDHPADISVSERTP